MQQLQSGTLLQGGKYRIERVLGQGGFGITYLAHNIVFDVDVAIKEFFLKDENERNGLTVTIPTSAVKKAFFDNLKEKFKKEAKRIFIVKNEHVVIVHDLFEENNTAYYVMDYIDGENLKERLTSTKKPLSENEIRQLLSQILDALKSIHDHGIYHLDLKPANIMVDKQGSVKLIDFGASKQFSSTDGLTTSTAYCYTPGYAPSEQIRQKADQIGPWTDFYALGATLYYLLTMDNPSNIDVEEDEDEAFSFPNGISDEMKNLVIWMMTPQRKKRPQSVDEIKKRIDKPQAAPPKEPLTFSKDEETIVLPSYTNFSDAEGFIRPKAIDLGLSVKWADCNVGSTSSVPAGGLYGWGDPTGGKTSKYVEDYCQDASNISGTKYDIATAMWGGGWCIPEKSHWKELIEKCEWNIEKSQGIQGYRVTGPNGNSIFLPFTGLRFGETVTNNNAGYYWTSENVPNDERCAFYYYIDTEKHNDIVTTRNYIYSGRAIRPIYKKED